MDDTFKVNIRRNRTRARLQHKRQLTTLAGLNTDIHRLLCRFAQAAHNLIPQLIGYALRRLAREDIELEVYCRKTGTFNRNIQL